MPTATPKIYAISILILLSGVALSFGFYYAQVRSNQLKKEKTVNSLYGGIHDNIQSEIDRNLNALYALRASYLAYDGWNREQFGKYANYYTSQIKSIQALEWVPAISHQERDSFELQTKAEGFEKFEIFTRENGQVKRAETRPIYYTVYFIEPLEGNEAGFGFDPGGKSPVRQNAIDLAISTGKAASSEIITIIQKTNPHKAVLVFVPIFDQTDHRLIGLVEGVYLIDQLVEAAIDELNLPPEANIVIDNNSKDNTLLGKHWTDIEISDVREGQITIASQQWNLYLEYSNPTSAYLISPFWMLIGSLVFTLLIVKVVFDILTDNRKELQKHVDELKKKNHDLEQYTYAASHDLQEPLHTIQSLTSLLDQDNRGQLDEKGNTYLKHIYEASQRMSELITSLLRYSKVGQNERLMWTNSAMLANNVLESLSSEIEKKKAIIEIKTPLPILMAFPTGLEQLLFNLISNGLKFQTTKNRPKIEISAVELKNGSWQFVVKDNGIGFSEEFNERIFSIFRTLHSRSIYPGVGFGLATCKKIVELHNGKIWVKSKPGIGSTFFFTLNLT